MPLKLWEQEWDAGAEKARQTHPIKELKVLPQIPGINETGLKWKSLKWMITHDEKGEVRRGIFKHPLKYGWAFLKSLFKKKAYRREGDFFLYGIPDLHAFEKLLKQPDALFVLGFSYCHKPFECPSGRFTAACQADPENPICRQCFIGKAVHLSPRERTFPLFIPTVHYIGGKIFEIAHANPGKPIVFMITACEMTLEMFGDWGNMVGIRGIGVCLDGRICNTMRMFELSERGVKPGLTVVLEPTKAKMLAWIHQWKENIGTTS